MEVIQTLVCLILTLWGVRLYAHTTMSGSGPNGEPLDLTTLVYEYDEEREEVIEITTTYIDVEHTLLVYLQKQGIFGNMLRYILMTPPETGMELSQAFLVKVVETRDSILSAINSSYSDMKGELSATVTRWFVLESMNEEVIYMEKTSVEELKEAVAALMPRDELAVQNMGAIEAEMIGEGRLRVGINQDPFCQLIKNSTGRELEGECQQFLLRYVINNKLNPIGWITQRGNLDHAKQFGRINGREGRPIYIEKVVKTHISTEEPTIAWARRANNLSCSLFHNAESHAWLCLGD